MLYKPESCTEPAYSLRYIVIDQHRNNGTGQHRAVSHMFLRGGIHRSFSYRSSSLVGQYNLLFITYRVYPLLDISYASAECAVCLVKICRCRESGKASEGSLACRHLILQQ